MIEEDIRKANRSTVWLISTVAAMFIVLAVVGGFLTKSLTRWRQRIGEEKLVALLQESLAVATRTQAMRPKDLSRVIIDTTVQPKAVMFPTDAKLINRAREIMVRLAKRHSVVTRVGKIALIKHQRYSHAHHSSAPIKLCASFGPISVG